VMPNVHGYATDCDTHARFENEFISHAVNLADVVPKLAPLQPRDTDYFGTALAFIKQSNALVERLYDLDKAGAFSIWQPPDPVGKDFAASRIAAGSSLLRDLWWSTYKNSELPAKPGPE
jgi:hypothetical protein